MDQNQARVREMPEHGIKGPAGQYSAEVGFYLCGGVAVGMRVRVAVTHGVGEGMRVGW